MKNKMNAAFQKFEGGLFSDVEKADVGSSYQELEEKGVDLMGWADPFMPDYSLPKHVLEATLQHTQGPLAAHYTAPIGNTELKKEIAKKLSSYNHLDVDAQRNILITPGSDSGLYYAMLSLLNVNDEVLIPSPSYPNNFQNCAIMNAKAINVPLYENNNYQIDVTEFEKRLTPKTKMVLLTHPNNPTTTVFNEQSLQALSKFIIDNDLVLVCDQAFEDFTFENKIITPASMDGMWERTITVFSVSKGMGFSGYRVGYIVTNDVFMDALYGAAVSVLGATNTIAQLAVLEAFKDSSFMNIFNTSFDTRRKKAYEIFNSIPNVSMLLPESGFLCWVNVNQLGDSSDIVQYLIEEAKVCVNDGINYGVGGEGHLRIVLGVYKDDQRVFDALERMKTALLKYKV